MPDLLRAALPTAPEPELAQSARRPFVADHAVQALAVGRAQPRAAAAAMAAWFRRTRRLGSQDRRRVAEIAYGVIRHEALLRRSGAQDDAALVKAWARLAEGERFEQLASEGPAADLATALSLPLPVAQEWLDRQGEEEAAQLAGRFAERAIVWLRVNADWGSREAAKASLARDGVLVVNGPGPWALELRGRVDLATTELYRHGGVEIQDLSSQALIQAIHEQSPLAGARVLDLCAGAGGKSLALAALKARVRAFDVRPQALVETARRARRACLDLDVGLPEGLYGLVLVDAPCSGIGRLMREPALRWGLEPGRYLEAQRALLQQGAAHVEPGGLLAYATCSLLAEENEHEAPAGFELVEEVLRWPHRQAGDGFGWRIWRRG